MDLLIIVEDIKVSPSATTGHLEMVVDNQLFYNGNITSVARSSRIAPYNIHRVWHFLTRETAQVLVQALVITCLNYCNSLLAGLPTSAIKSLQCGVITTAHVVFNLRNSPM